MQTDTGSIEQFITQNNISMTAQWADTNPNMEGSREMDNWKVTISMKPVDSRAKRMTTYFSQGYGFKGKGPELKCVLSCLADDAASIENASSFEDWCGDCGYDSDSRKAEKTYKACEHSAKRLENFLGRDLYEQLLWNTERE